MTTFWITPSLARAHSRMVACWLSVVDVVVGVVAFDADGLPETPAQPVNSKAAPITPGAAK